MIKTFANKETAACYRGLHVRRFGSVWLPIARRKLAQIDNIADVVELRIPPGNRLEKLSGQRADQWSIRVNDQWRICFVWREGHAWEVEIVDYH